MQLVSNKTFLSTDKCVLVFLQYYTVTVTSGFIKHILNEVQRK